MNILTDKYFAEYKRQLTTDVDSLLNGIGSVELSGQSFTFYTSVAVISSSRIEGERMDADSYIKHKMQDIEYQPDLVEKPDDLYNTYVFAQQNKLALQNFLQSHILLAAHLLPEKWQGKYRKNEMLVMEHNTGKIQFEAAPFNILDSEMERLWQDIDDLNVMKLSTEEVCYYASLIHLSFVCIHPFNDGNGRAARLLEKWFLVAHLGDKAWYIKPEKYYYDHVNDYYKNLNGLGMFYEQLDYSKALPFLLMLPQSFTI